MTPNDSPGWWLLTVDVTLFPLAVVLLALVLLALRRVERAAWAVVSQLQALRRDESRPAVPAHSPEIKGAAQADSHVAYSMFGR
jgi:hypothetical protein